MTTTVSLYTKKYPSVNAVAFGAKLDGETDDYASIQAAIDFADKGHSGISGWDAAVVQLPGGLARISQKLTVPNFVRLEGISPRGTKIMPVSGYADASLIEFTDASGTESLFDSGFSNMWLDADSNANITDVVLSLGLQENTRCDSFVMSSFDTRGLTFSTGNGSASAQVINAEIGPNDGGTGIYCDATGVTSYVFERITINGEASTTTVGIDMVQDNAVLIACHFEDCGIGVRQADDTAVTAINCKALNSTVSVFQVDDASQRLRLINCFPNGATNLVDNNWYGGDVTRAVADYRFPNQQNFSDDATPSLINDPVIVQLTSTTGVTTLTQLDDVYPGQTGNILFIDSGGTHSVDFTGTFMVGNGGSDWTPSNGDSMTFFISNGGYAHCQISG